MFEYNEVSDAIDNLIKLNMKIRKNLDPDIRMNISAGSFAVDFCTVRFNIGRRVGKTRYIEEHADDHSLTIVANHHIRRNLRNTKGMIFTAHEIDSGGLHIQNQTRYLDGDSKFSGVDHYKSDGKIFEFTRVYVDEPSFVFKDKNHMLDIYHIICRLNRNTTPTFILLGS
jgi:hypothetical protein